MTVVTAPECPRCSQPRLMVLEDVAPASGTLFALDAPAAPCPTCSSSR